MWTCIVYLAVACANEPRASTNGRLVPAEQSLARTFVNKGIKVFLPTPDTLLVHFPIGRDILRNGPRRVANLDSASLLVARRALAVVDSSGAAPLNVVVELTRSRQLGPFVWGAGSTRHAYSAAELRQAPALSSTSPPSPIP